ncbi:MAG TPA: formate/nitrite transporter family protein [Methylophilaceae bacterium]|nr:formate/nitrite transporter family protein [Methylophilaceae bacterium]
MDDVDQDQQSIEEEGQQRASPPGETVHAAILEEGRHELQRSSQALWWSGLAAGLSMGFSMIGEGLLASHMPDTEWRKLVATLGYSFGFLIVVLGRQQLFTENTLTAFLPWLHQKSSAAFSNVMRLWIIVFIANLVGASIVAWTAMHTPLFEQPVRDEFIALGQQAMAHSFGIILLKGVFAGWLIALMVWLLPFAETARVWVIILITYLIGLGEFSHVIAGSVETFALAAAGVASWGGVLAGFVLPALIGNVLGGVVLVAVLNHAQVVAR